MYNRVRHRRFGGLLLTALGGCGPYVEGHAVATHTAADVRHVDASAVRVSALTVPEGAATRQITQPRREGQYMLGADYFVVAITAG